MSASQAVDFARSMMKLEVASRKVAQIYVRDAMRHTRKDDSTGIYCQAPAQIQTSVSARVSINYSKFSSIVSSSVIIRALRRLRFVKAETHVTMYLFINS